MYIKLKPKLPWCGRRESDGMGMMFGYCVSLLVSALCQELKSERQTVFETEWVSVANVMRDLRKGRKR
jgi:hypothetical protein